MDAAAAQALGTLGRAGVAGVLLKGPSITRWLYADDPSRIYVDIDLLIAPADIGSAEEILGSLGYKRHFDDRAMPDWWREHAGDWVREHDGVTVDLHRVLPGVGLDAAAAWNVLAAHFDHMSLAGRRVRILERPALALHVALHAAHHGLAVAQPMRDLRRALETAGDDVWRPAAELAVELEATDAFATGLRLAAKGAGLADRLGLPSGGSTGAQLRAITPPPVALGIEQLARAGDMRQRAAILWHKLVPPPAFVRHWDPRAADGRWALLRAYIRRPIWILRHAPRGIAAWRRAGRAEPPSPDSGLDRGQDAGREA